MERLIEDCKQYVRELMSGDGGGHDYYHTLRVYNNAINIAKSEDSVDIVIVSLGTLLHDVDDIKLFDGDPSKNINARHFLENHNVDSATIDRVCNIINTVSFGGKSRVPDTIEGKIIQDADRLDALGAIAIARTFAYGGKMGTLIYDPENPYKEDMTEEEYRNSRGASINHFYEKVLKLEKYINTDYAKKIARARTQFVLDYLDEFYAEWNGEK